MSGRMLGETGLWVDDRGDGPPVLLLAGLGDPAEAWAFQLEGLSDRYRTVAMDNRGVGRSPLPPAGLSVPSMADDAAAVLDGLGIGRAHVVGFSGGSAVAQELALRHPDRVASLVLVGTWAEPDPFLTRAVAGWRWMAERAPSDRAFLEAFYVWVYTARAHENGMVDALVEDALAFPHPQSLESLHRQIDAFVAHTTVDRLGEITVPTLVVAGEEDLICPPRLGRRVADGIPGARFVVLPGEAHQPFQESPEAFNAMVDEFWRSLPG